MVFVSGFTDADCPKANGRADNAPRNPLREIVIVTPPGAGVVLDW
jgi:hypothetical protein